MSYLILSTYPGTGSKNSGDDLIGKSLVNLLAKIKGNDIDYDIVSLPDQGVEAIKDFSKYKAVLAPGLRPTLNGSKVAPKNRTQFLENAPKMGIPIYAIGAGWSTYPGTIKQSTHLKLDEEEKRHLIQYFGATNEANNAGLISCRDITTENLLRNNGINCYGTTGDCALFDYDLIGTKPVLPKKIKKVAISMPHIKSHWQMAYSLALKIKREFSCEVYLTFHGYRGRFEKLINPSWNRELVNIVDLSGGAEKLAFYDEIDIHIGFRLHAHIWFLRTRKPSLLIAEDGRGYGHLATVNGLGYSAASKMAIQQADQMITVDHEMVKEMRKTNPSYRAIKMFKEEIKNGYPITKNTLTAVDNLWTTKFRPLLELLP
ncbi:polysaccharide pyruvyl transferase family protein [Fredinandcohnia sp. FSL W7-1320]|uniref:polysaccharide pyruvyl transferase family protein n=1 Tax=Fredinandcohnia sp. FSL W7-1320 TaxID=2954540 RepID=UPI0030FD84A0